MKIGEVRKKGKVGILGKLDKVGNRKLKIGIVGNVGKVGEKVM